MGQISNHVRVDSDSFLDTLEVYLKRLGFAKNGNFTISGGCTHSSHLTRDGKFEFLG